MLELNEQVLMQIKGLSFYINAICFMFLCASEAEIFTVL